MNRDRGTRRHTSRRTSGILLVLVLLIAIVAVGTGSAQAETSGANAPAAILEPATAPMPGGFTPIAPSRALDTRDTPPCVGSVPRTLTIGGTFDIPADASAVALNVTVVDPTGVGYATVWPAGDPQPEASNLNFLPGDVVPNMVIVELGTGGAINIATNNGCPNVVVDIAGSFAGGTPVATVPGAPTAVDGAPGHQEVLLNWTAPASDGGSPITGYAVTPSQGGVALAPHAFASTATTQTITGLTDGLPYMFTVAATNAVGTGPASTASIAYTPTASCTQAPPSPLNGTAITMVVDNTSAFADDQVYVTLTGGVANGYSSWGAAPYDIVNNSIPMSCLAQDPSDPSGHSRIFSLGEGVSAGLLWISLGEPIPVGASGLPTVQPSFDTSLYRFANVEFAYPGLGDMTNVDQFSFPVDLDVWSSPVDVTQPPDQSSHYSGTTCDIVSALKTEVTAQGANADWSQIKVADSGGDFVRIVAPKQRARQLDSNGGTPNPFRQGWPSMLPYVQSMANQAITVQGLFTPGAASPYFSETGWYSYTGTFDASGDITLNGTIGAPVATGIGTGGWAGSAVSVQASSQDINGAGTAVGNDGLATGIYDQNSQYAVAGVNRNGWTGGSPDPAGPNDVYNSIYRDFTTAYTYGYWGGIYGSNSSAFWQTFQAPAAPAGGQPGFAAARPPAGDAFVAFNVFSEVMFQFSNNYNIPYGEDYGSGAPSRPSPLLSVPSGGRWKMTIKGDGPAGCLANY